MLRLLYIYLIICLFANYVILLFYIEVLLTCSFYLTDVSCFKIHSNNVISLSGIKYFTCYCVSFLNKIIVCCLSGPFGLLSYKHFGGIWGSLSDKEWKKERLNLASFFLWHIFEKCYTFHFSSNTVFQSHYFKIIVILFLIHF